jgi:hypothetical protein
MCILIVQYLHGLGKNIKPGKEACSCHIGFHVYSAVWTGGNIRLGTKLQYPLVHAHAQLHMHIIRHASLLCLAAFRATDHRFTVQ